MIVEPGRPQRVPWWRVRLCHKQAQTACWITTCPYSVSSGVRIPDLRLLHWWIPL